MVIAPACQAGDRGFNPRRSRFTPLSGGFLSGCSAVASALGSGPRGREFKSPQPEIQVMMNGKSISPALRALPRPMRA